MATWQAFQKVIGAVPGGHGYDPTSNVASTDTNALTIPLGARVKAVDTSGYICDFVWVKSVESSADILSGQGCQTGTVSTAATLYGVKKQIAGAAATVSCTTPVGVFDVPSGTPGTTVALTAGYYGWIKVAGPCVLFTESHTSVVGETMYMCGENGATAGTWTKVDDWDVQSAALCSATALAVETSTSHLAALRCFTYA